MPPSVAAITRGVVRVSGLDTQVYVLDARTPGEVPLSATTGEREVQGYLAHTTRPPPSDLPRNPGIGLPEGPRGKQFLMSEVPL